ncbi:MAG: hypothetical protein HY925_07930 [Elusimicrobia bacterium]|nr:hypothetical protein [Elusimicrobiota bacterium]
MAPKLNPWIAALGGFAAALLGVIAVGAAIWFSPSTTLIARDVPGNAGVDFLRAADLLADAAPSEEGLRDSLNDRNPALADLEQGLRRRENRITGVLVRPQGIEELLAHASRFARLARAARAFKTTGDRFSKRGDFGAAATEYRKGVSFGVMMLEDYDLNARMLGLRLAEDCGNALMDLLAVHDGADSSKRFFAEIRPLFAAVELEPAAAERIISLTERPPELVKLLPFISAPAEKRRNLPFVLTMTTLNWSDRELAAGRPDPARERFLAHLQASPEPLVSSLGSTYRSALRSLPAALGDKADKRRRRLQRYKTRLLLDPDQILELKMDALSGT